MWINHWDHRYQQCLDTKRSCRWWVIVHKQDDKTFGGRVRYHTGSSLRRFTHAWIGKLRKEMATILTFLSSLRLQLSIPIYHAPFSTSTDYLEEESFASYIIHSDCYNLPTMRLFQPPPIIFRRGVFRFTHNSFGLLLFQWLSMDGLLFEAKYVLK